MPNFSIILDDQDVRRFVQAGLLAEAFSDVLDPTLVFHAYRDPGVVAALETYGCDAERLVVICDVVTRETRLMSRWDVQQEVAAAVWGRIWSGRQ